MNLIFDPCVLFVWCQTNVLHKPQEREAIWHQKQAALLEQVREAELSALQQLRSKQDSADQRLSLIQADLEQAREKEVELAAALLKERERGAELAVKVMEEEQGRQDDHDRYSEALALLKTDHAHKQHVQHRCTTASAHLNAMYTRWIVLQFVYATWNSYTKFRRREILQIMSTRLKNKNSIRTWSSLQRAACKEKEESAHRSALASAAAHEQQKHAEDESSQSLQRIAAEDQETWEVLPKFKDAEAAIVVAEKQLQVSEESAKQSPLASAAAHEQQELAEGEAVQTEDEAAKARQKNDEDDQKATTVTQKAGVGAMMHFLANVFSPSNSPSFNSMPQNGREDPGSVSPGKLAAGQGGAGSGGMYVCTYACILRISDELCEICDAAL